MGQIYSAGLGGVSDTRIRISYVSRFVHPGTRRVRMFYSGQFADALRFISKYNHDFKDNEIDLILEIDPDSEVDHAEVARDLSKVITNEELLFAGITISSIHIRGPSKDEKRNKSMIVHIAKFLHKCRFRIESEDSVSLEHGWGITEKYFTKLVKNGRSDTRIIIEYEDVTRRNRSIKETFYENNLEDALQFVNRNRGVFAHNQISLDVYIDPYSEVSSVMIGEVIDKLTNVIRYRSMYFKGIYLSRFKIDGDVDYKITPFMNARRRVLVRSIAKFLFDNRVGMSSRIDRVDNIIIDEKWGVQPYYFRVLVNRWKEAMERESEKRKSSLNDDINDNDNDNDE